MKKKDKGKILAVLLAVMLILSCLPANMAFADGATTVPLGTAASFAVLAAAGITNTGTTTITGDVGTFPITTEDYTAGTLTLTGGSTDYAGGDPTPQAMTALTNAYNDAASATATYVYAVQAWDIGGDTFEPGVYQYPSSLAITGTVTLDAQNDPGAVFIFQIGSTLTTAAGSIASPASIVSLVNGAQASNVFWQVGSSATLGTYSTFIGTILANTSIIADTGATVDGRLLAGAITSSGAVTLDDNTVSVPVAVLAQTSTPTITTPIYAGATSVSGTSADSADISLTVNGGTAQTTTANPSGSWTVTVPALVTGDSISVTAQATGYTVSQAATATVVAVPVTGLTFSPASGSTITTSTPITITASPALATSEAVYWNTTGPLPMNDTLYQNGFNLPVSGTVYAAVYAPSTGSWSDQTSAAFTVSAPATNSTISQTKATFDKYTSGADYTDVPVALTLNGNTLTDIKSGSATLTPDTDYTTSVSGSVYTVTIPKNYLSSLSVGTTDLTFDFSAGASATLAVTVEDTTPVAWTLSAANPTYTVSSSNNSLLITVPASVTDAALTTTPTQKVPGGNETFTLPQVNTTSTTSDGNVYVNIPAETVVTGPSTWKGTINLPQVVGNPTVTVSGYNTTVDAAIELGDDSTSLTFSQPVQILLAGQSGEDAGWIQNGVFTAIPQFTSNAEPTTPAEAIADLAAIGSNDGYYTDSNNNLEIWTTHFTTFVAYNETAISSGSNSSNSGGGGGGGADTYLPAVQTEAASTVTAGSAVLNGDITSDSGYAITDYGFLWGINSSSLTNKLDVGADNRSGAFTTTLGSLTADMTYYFQAYATNSYGTVDGAVMSFTAGGMSQPTPTTFAAPVFSDVSATYWGYVAISSLGSQGIVSGYPDGTFKPDATITRAEFATMQVKALGLNTSGTTGTFTDVTAGSWYNGSVNAAVAAGLVSGMGNSLFAPNAPITREQMAAMVARALGDNAPTTNGAELNAFSDRSAVSSWAVSGMDKAVKSGIVSGMTADTLAPMANSTRAQAAMMIYKMLTVLGK